DPSQTWVLSTKTRDGQSTRGSTATLRMSRTCAPNTNRWLVMANHSLGNNRRFVAEKAHCGLLALVGDGPSDSHCAAKESFLEEVVQRGPNLADAHMLPDHPSSCHGIPDRRRLSALDRSDESQHLAAKPRYVASC